MCWILYIYSHKCIDEYILPPKKKKKAQSKYYNLEQAFKTNILVKICTTSNLKLGPLVKSLMRLLSITRNWIWS